MIGTEVDVEIVDDDPDGEPYLNATVSNAYLTDDDIAVAAFPFDEEDTPDYTDRQVVVYDDHAWNELLTTDGVDPDNLWEVNAWWDELLELALEGIPTLYEHRIQMERYAAAEDRAAAAAAEQAARQAAEEQAVRLERYRIAARLTGDAAIAARFRGLVRDEGLDAKTAFDDTAASLAAAAARARAGRDEASVACVRRAAGELVGRVAVAAATGATVPAGPLDRWLRSGVKRSNPVWTGEQVRLPRGRRSEWTRYAHAIRTAVWKRHRKGWATADDLNDVAFSLRFPGTLIGVGSDRAVFEVDEGALKVYIGAIPGLSNDNQNALEVDNWETMTAKARACVVPLLAWAGDRSWVLQPVVDVGGEEGDLAPGCVELLGEYGIGDLSYENLTNDGRVLDYAMNPVASVTPLPPGVVQPPELWWLVPGARVELTYGEGASETTAAFRVLCVRPPAGEAQKMVILRKAGSKALYELAVQASGGSWLRAPKGKVYRVGAHTRKTNPSRPSRLHAVHAALVQRASTKDPSLAGVRIKRCPDADQDHAELVRNFMHVGHKPGVICYAGAAEDLKLPWQVGLLAHELGHLSAMNDDREHSENDANEIGSLLTDTRVHWRGPMLVEWAKPPKWLKEAVR
jgi:hypothetical protein